MRQPIERGRPNMSKRFIYKAHKWIGVTVGGFLLIWLISGVVMILPAPSSGPPRQPSPAALDLQAVSVSPAEAVATVAKLAGGAPEVTSLELRRVATAVVYEISVAGGGAYLIDARSNQPFTITSEVAGQLVRDRFPSPSQVQQSDLLSTHDMTYPLGPLPVYRVVLAGDPSTLYYVSPRDGTVSRSDRWSRAQNALASLHTFEPLKLLVRSSSVRRGLLIIASVIGIMAALTGYYLALPRRRV